MIAISLKEITKFQKLYPGPYKYTAQERHGTVHFTVVCNASGTPLITTGNYEDAEGTELIVKTMVAALNAQLAVN